MNNNEVNIEKIRSFNRFYTNIIGVVDRYILNSQYSLTEVRIIYEINHHHDLTARKIKDLLQVDEGYLSRILDKLIRQKMIIRVQSREDKRNYFLSLTEKGKQDFGKLNSLSQQSIAQMIDGLSPAQIEKLTGMMMEIKEILNQGV